MEVHAPELYVAEAVAEPLSGLAAVDDAAVEQYHADGYLAVADVFSSEQVEAAKAGLAHLIDGKNPDFKGVQFEKSVADRVDEMSSDERYKAVRKLMYFCDYDERLNAMMADATLLDVVGRLMGDEPEIFQEMALLKPPGGVEKPWHQDHAYFDLSITNRIVGVWIALDEATIENGCMHVLPGGHREGPRTHFRRRDWQLCDTDMLNQPCTAVPLKPGSLLFFDSMIPHGTPINQSDHRRQALQFHYVPKDAIKDVEGKNKQLFGSDGKDVEC